jgi:hypothetical protein
MKITKFDMLMWAIVTVSSLCFIWTLFPTAEQRELSDKILKDADGNYYKVEHKLGNTFTIEVISAEDLF